MLTLSLVSLLITATPDRAARLIDEGDRAELAMIEQKAAALRHTSGGVVAARVVGGVLLGAALVVPVVCGVVPLVLSFFVGLIGLVAWSSSVLSIIPVFWEFFFSWIPDWGWLAIGGAALLGALLFGGSFLADLPRRHELAELHRQRRDVIVRDAERRLQQQRVEVPMTTLLSF